MHISLEMSLIFVENFLCLDSKTIRHKLADIMFANYILNNLIVNNPDYLKLVPVHYVETQ